MKRLALFASLILMGACTSGPTLPPPNYQGIDPLSPDVGSQHFGSTLLFPGATPFNGKTLGGSFLALTPALTAENLISQNYNRDNISTAAAMVDGQVYFMALSLFTGQVVTNVVVPIAAAGVGITLSKAGLYDSSLNRLAVSADQGAAWQSTGIMIVPMISPVTITSTGLYYVALVSKASTTLPSPVRGATGTSAQFAVGPVGSGKARAGVLAGQTDLPSVGSMSQTATTTVFWVGVN